MRYSKFLACDTIAILCTTNIPDEEKEGKQLVIASYGSVTKK